MRIVTLVPAYNEGARIAATIRDALLYSQVVVVIDDCSRDDTAHVAESVGAVVLRHSLNRGQGAALQTGTEYALAHLEPDVLVHFDADGQMRGSEIPDLVAPIVRGEVEVVLGSRFLGKQPENIPWARLAILQAGVVFTALVSGLRITDSQNGFRALSRSAAQVMRITLDGVAHASEILDLVKVTGLKYTERPVTITYSAETLQKSPSNWRAVRIVKDFMKKKVVH